jgi:hypothetical protein
MYQPNTKAWLFDYSSEYFHVLCPATTFSLISLFVLDTPAYISTAFTANIGKSPNDWLLASSTGIEPLRGSPGAALIGCGVFTPDGYLRSTCDWTGVSLSLLPVIALPVASWQL